MLRDFSLSLTFVALVLIAYTIIVLFNKKTSEVNMRATAAIKATAAEPADGKAADSSPAN